MPRHEVVRENPDTGWSDWLSPTHRRYQMSCCDCGLVHTLRFRVVRMMRHLGGKRFRHSAPVAGYRVQFQARRDARATAQMRRHRRKRERL